ncbi:MAG TPA: UvrD-helicase domain-containing protein [Verrucomicrobiae bacterium]
MRTLTESQRRAVAAQGNVLVVAGAGTGKTSTLVARCVARLEEGCSLENILMVTFTDAAAAEMRERIRHELSRRARPAATPERSAWLDQQLALLDTAFISTLSSFCLQLVREHFYELEIDPQVSVLDEQQTWPLIEETLDALLQRHYGGDSSSAKAVQELVRQQAGGSDEKIRRWIVKLHRHAQTLPDPERWLAQQLAAFAEADPVSWRKWLAKGFSDWCKLWLPMLRAQPMENSPAHRSAKALAALQRPALCSHADITAALAEIVAADQDWPDKKKTVYRTPLETFFAEAGFLHSVTVPSGDRDPLAEDWEWVRHHMAALLRLTEQFTAEFSLRKREAGGVDFADVEQFALRLLRHAGSGEPTATARSWQERFHHVFVDESQDINAAQDAIISALSRDGAAANRFLVGDVKQSIYRFRLADPSIFRGYQERWHGGCAEGQCISLSENFRSREVILEFVNALFAVLMRPAIGGVAYDEAAKLRFGAPEERKALSLESPQSKEARVELHLLSRSRDDTEGAGAEDEGAVARQELVDLAVTEREARLLALRLRELKTAGHLVWDDKARRFRPATWRDMVVLLRSPSGKVESFAKEFARAGVPLQAARAGFFEALEIMDLLNLLKLLDNPLQDVPLLAVLRSSLVGLSLDELAEIRAHNRERVFWTALRRYHGEMRIADCGLRIADCEMGKAESVWKKVDLFLSQFERWRELIRQTSLSVCLEAVGAETYYEDLLLAEPRGAELVANVRRLIELAREYDPYQRQGLFRFLRFVEAQQDAELDYEPAPAPAQDAVRLMSIHKSKGLEFPVVALAGLGGQFNLQDLREDILLDDDFGLCPKVAPPEADLRYPSLPYWLAGRHARRELLGEELRLLYVALTRARDTLILAGTAASKAAGERWEAAEDTPPSDQRLVSARSCLDWLRLCLPMMTKESDWRSDRDGQSALLGWTIYAENDTGFLLPAGETSDAGGAACQPAQIDPQAWEELCRRITWKYSFQAATAEPAKTSASALRRRRTEEDDEARTAPFVRTGFGLSRKKGSGELSAAARGTAHHTFLQYVSLEKLGGVADLKDEASRMQQAARLSAEEVAALNFGTLASFWQSPLGRRIRAQTARVQRELPFTARFTPEELATLHLSASAGELSGEFIVVQGVVDLAVIQPEEIWVVDFKTDEMTGAELAEKQNLYAPQLQLYALALGRIHRRPVKERWLHFLALGKTVAV